ncbi:2OG-Fe(II) oxygenase [Novipirellula artificiosorum]|uniref:Fe2OG dioxygenase domain-containing protein n=1 Tax=Novipirellula artificiosorum TaxID=2528016 RepID=A0A5C6D352_9BACT|nr:2OG-Fe(II) oxygenase [Novipirellula artificiosorum]TWU31613.1 hypothetical protein Poly41_61700 [Novipirellula artificiosorum]
MLRNLVRVKEGIFTIANLFTPQECEQWIALSESLCYQPAPINTQSGPERQLDVRNNTRVLLDDEQKSDELWQRIAQDVPNVAKGWTSVGLNERMRFYRYDVGERFRWHADGIHRRENGQKSFLTFLVYLNDDFSGGETAFSGGLKIRPQVGMALLFSHWLKHMGAEVRQGRKYVLRSDVMFVKTEQ